MRLSRRMRAFLKCFITVTVAFWVVVLAISNGASAIRLLWSVVDAVGHAPQELGHTDAVLACVGGGLLGALLISSHRHLGDQLPGDTKWLLGGGVTVLLAALVLAFDLAGLHHRMRRGGGRAEPPVSISAEAPQASSGGERSGASPHGHGGSAGSAEAVDYTPAEGEAPSASSAIAHEAVFTPPSEEQEAEGTGEPSEEEPEQAEAAEPEASSATESSVSTTASSYTSVSATTSFSAGESSASGTSEASEEAGEETMPEGECDEE